MFTILTRPISWKYYFQYRLKEALKRVVFSHTFGPKSVIESIIKWLGEVPNIIWNHNPDEKYIYKTVYVPVGVETLKYALNLKYNGKIQKLIVGPNITIPTSKKDIFFDSNIDYIIVPSLWVKNMLSHLFWEDDRIIVIPSWVEDRWARKSMNEVIVYRKNCPKDLYNYIINSLESQWISYRIFTYWSFSKDDYLLVLDDTKMLVYLQNSESQWLALHEAWMKDVPTLVWNWWFCKYPLIDWHDKKISAPYLTSQCGMFFSSVDDFDTTFASFHKGLHGFNPREYSLEKFSNIATVSSLLKYIL